jgi:hypothetical protein
MRKSRITDLKRKCEFFFFQITVLEITVTSYCSIETRREDLNKVGYKLESTLVQNAAYVGSCGKISSVRL